VRNEALAANPKMADVLNRVSAMLDEATIAEMNYKVDGEKMEPRDVAHDFLKAKGHRALSSVRVGGEAGTSIADVVAVARHGASVEWRSRSTRASRGARVVLRHGGGDAPIYGVNSALGANTGQRLDAADLGDYQRRAIRARAVAVGPAYDSASVRAMLVARIAGMAAGGSGVSQHVLDALVAMVNRGVHPVVPRFGSIGVADLPQLSHLALPLIGEGDAEVDGTTLSGADACAAPDSRP
jgi:histidine ammonia-lyase